MSCWRQNALISFIKIFLGLAIRSEFQEFDKNADFERMFERFHSGDCLITLATGVLSPIEEKRTGLVPTHAYACLDIRKFKVKFLKFNFFA